ncbi:DUF4846 domain-containing protein [Myxococcota bacterium]|nr:DUF4846 domain-containing protein [Myxococcota bacterium]MBU1433069.1 DUF4846 domain-containing protein [Myxococcota bacterium]MBU1896506.1 DUF4846 domain-containing protein [Myxococcota bacterium]
MLNLALLIGLLNYPWLAEMSTDVETRPLEATLATPEGFQRVAVEPDSYAAWLRGLPTRTDRAEVYAYDGARLDRPSAAIIYLDIGVRDRQQCADTVIRLHAEHLWSRGRAEAAGYHFTSGDLSTWKAWRSGERFKPQGIRVVRARGRARANTHKAYRGWLDHLFIYAGTQSLWRDSRPVGARPYEAGDFFVQPGGPGHAVILLDIAQDAQGRRAALIGQGFMPAEDLHVLKGSHDRVLNDVWFLLPDEAHPTLVTPSWSPFKREEARRFK